MNPKLHGIPGIQSIVESISLRRRGVFLIVKDKKGTLHICHYTLISALRKYTWIKFGKQRWK